MDEDNLSGALGLAPIEVTQKPLFDSFFSSVSPKLSDYSFANTYIWRGGLFMRWRMLRGMLCIFANGNGGLTLLFPPLGEGDLLRAASEAIDLCHAFNAIHGYKDIPRIEYATDTHWHQFAGMYLAEPMSGDYIYETRKMIDLDGKALASKRHARNRFERLYQVQTRPYCEAQLDDCLALVHRWSLQHSSNETAQADSISTRRRGLEVQATTEALKHSSQLGLTGLTLYADNALVGFSFGEFLGEDTCNILIEKADRNFPGSAQYIFSTFCRQCWSDTRWCNAGDDWDVPALAWTKQSYKPARRENKWTFTPKPKCQVRVHAGVSEGTSMHSSTPQNDTMFQAGLGDLDALYALERSCFESSEVFSRRQMRYLLQCRRCGFFAIRRNGCIVASVVVLVRQTRRGLLGRIYSLAVHEEYRGQGLGRELMSGCLGYLRNHRVEAVILEVRSKNIPAIRLYESTGFHRVACVNDYYGPGQDAWKMRLALQTQTHTLVGAENIGIPT